MTVLEAEVPMGPGQKYALPARLKKVWHKLSLIRRQLHDPARTPLWDGDHPYDHDE